MTRAKKHPARPAPTTGPAPVFDAHAHVFRPSAVAPRPVDELTPAGRDAPVEDLLDLMDRNGVRHAMLVPLAPDDRYVPHCVARYPQRLVGAVVAGPELQGRAGPDVEPLVKLRRIRERFDLRAVRTGWLGTPTADVIDSPMMPTLKYLNDHTIPLWSYLPADQLPLLEQLAHALPELRIVLNHFGFCPADMAVDRDGRPYFDRGFTSTQIATVERMASHNEVYLMFSGQYALSHQSPPHGDIISTVRRLADRFGAERMLWASDYPWTRNVPGYSELLGLPAAMLPDATPDELTDILGGTARRLFRLAN